ncbi:MAG TPA: zinc-ribbon domain-containing protein [Chloroflexia bacterium]|nr:zinc-ribbon domain-containing protein [Chloroflexia bacterium]
MKCPQCGVDARPGQKFCASCGATLAILQAPPVAGASSEPPLPQTKPLTPLPEQASVEAEAVEPQGYTPDYTPESMPQEHRTGSFTPYQSPIEGELTTSGASSRLPVLIAVVVALLVIVGTLIAVAVSMREAAGDLTVFTPVASPMPEATGVPVEPSALLEKSAEAMREVKTLRYQGEAGFYGVITPEPSVEGTQAISVTISGEVQLPDSYTMNTDVSRLGQFIVIDDKTWSRQNGNPRWTLLTGEDVSLGPANPLAATQYMRYARPDSVQLVGQEERVGKRLYRLRFDVDTEDMANDSSSASVRNLLLNSRITTDVWIQDDYLLDSISIAVDLGDDRGAIVRSFFSEYNADVRIEPPEDVGP